MIVEHGKEVIISTGGFPIRITKTLNTISKTFTLQKIFSNILMKRALAIKILQHVLAYYVSDLHGNLTFYFYIKIAIDQQYFRHTVAHSIKSQRQI